MPAATFSKLSDEPIVILTISGNVAALSSSERDYAQLRSLFDSVSEPVFFILDMSNARINLEDLIHGAHDAYLGDSPLFKHPNICQILHVSNDPMLELATEGLNNEIFGNVEIQMFKTLEEALAYARGVR